MFKALSFAVAVDMTLVFRLWDSEPVLLAYWITAFAYTFIAVTTGGLVVMLLYYNFYLGDDHDDSK